MIDVINPFAQFEWTSHVACAFTILLALVIIHTTIVLRRRPQRRYPVAPGALPFLGHALSLANSDEFLTVLTKWAKDVGKDGTYEFSLFGQRWIVLCSADTFIKAMRMRPYKIQRASMLSDAIASLGIHGLFSAEGQHWKNDRRIVGPALNKNHIEDYFHFIKLVANRLVMKWKDEKEAVSALTDLSKYALDIVALSLLGMDFDSLNNPGHNLTKDIEDLFQVAFKRTLSPLPYWKLYDNLDGGRDIAERVIKIFRSLVRDCHKQKEDGNKEQEQKRGTRSFLQKLIDISDGNDAKLDEDRVVGNLVTLIMAGKDTTSTTLAVCLWEIAHDAELQDELYKEISESGIDVENLTMSDVMNGFPRLHSLLFEVLRVKGPSPLLFLEPGEAVDFQGGVLKPGTIICAMTRTLGEKAVSEIPMGPRGEGPEQFCPRRWLIVKNTSGQSESLTVMQPSNKYGGYMAFGHGARICPGAHLAKVEAITGLFCILRKFELAPIENHPPIRRVIGITETFDGEMKLTLKLRV